MAKLKWDGNVLWVNEQGMALNGSPVPTSSMERRLLLFLMAHPDTALSRETLLREVWGYSVTGITRTVDTHVKVLRAHMGGLAPLLVTVRGVGYRLDTDANQAQVLRCCA